MKSNPRKTIRHGDGSEAERFGEMECAFYKAGCEFVLGKKLSHREQTGTEFNAKEPMKSVKIILKKWNHAN